jgi:tRNA (adenine37-N6)-methyltransferase
VEATIELLPGRNFEQALKDLAGFERIWVIAWLHLNENWQPTVIPPRGPKVRRGLFATRSPHRPNPIAISALKLVRIEGLTLHVHGIDLLDGTPVLDIKPYVPYADAFPDAREGWLEEIGEAPDAPDRWGA